MTAPPLLGLYTAANTGTSPGQTPSTSQTWPWPNDSWHDAEHLPHHERLHSRFLGSPPRLLLTTDAAYQQIMRLYNWNYVVDNVGTTPCDWRIRFFGTDDNTVLLQQFRVIESARQ